MAKNEITLKLHIAWWVFPFLYIARFTSMVMFIPLCPLKVAEVCVRGISIKVSK